MRRRRPICLRTLYSTRFFDKPGDAARGKQAFESHHCADCHGITESKAEGDEIAVDMGNHAPRMIQPVPQLSPSEMRQLLSYLWMRQIRDGQGRCRAR